MNYGKGTKADAGWFQEPNRKSSLAEAEQMRVLMEQERMQGSKKDLHHVGFCN